MTEHDIVLGLATVVVFGVGAQWLGRRSGIPSVLLLLPAGLLAGPVLGLVEPQKLFGELLFPGVTLLVSLLLFQSGLEMRVADLPSAVRGSVARLVSLGLVVTFLGATLAVTLVLDLPGELAFLTGAVLVVSGPTVVGPMLRNVRPQPPTGAVLNWESTALDPVGATLGVVVLNLVVASDRADLHPVLQVLQRLGLGIGVGLVAAALLVLVMARYFVTDEMEPAVALMFAVAAFATAELVLSEAGLFATLTLGFVTANQQLAPTARISGFGETLEVIVIGSLFVVLGALVELDALWDHALHVVLVVAALVVVVRPVTAALCLARSPLTTRERMFVGSVDPRGIVAAATAAQFSGPLTQAGYDTDFLLPTVFGVILGTGIVYGLSAPHVARVLDVRESPPTRVALIGDDPWLAAMGRSLNQAGADTLVVSPGPVPEHHRDAVDGDVDVRALSIHDGAEWIEAELEQASIARALISTGPNAVVTLVEARLIELIGRRHVRRVPDADPSTLARVIPDGWAVPSFGGINRSLIAERVEAGAEFRVLSEPAGPETMVLAAVHTDGTVDFVPRSPVTVQDGTLVVLDG